MARNGCLIAQSLPPRPDRAPRKRLVGIGLMCAALICFSGLDTTAKWLNRSYDPLLTVWWRYAASMVLVSSSSIRSAAPGVLRTRRPWAAGGLRSLLLFISTALNFFALQYLQLAETISIMFATPLLVALLAGPMLGEWVGPRRLAAIGVGFIGVLIVTRPGIGAMHPAMLLSVPAPSPTPSTRSRRACSPATIPPPRPWSIPALPVSP